MAFFWSSLRVSQQFLIVCPHRSMKMVERKVIMFSGLYQRIRAFLLQVVLRVNCGCVWCWERLVSLCLMLQNPAAQFLEEQDLLVTRQRLRNTSRCCQARHPLHVTEPSSIRSFCVPIWQWNAKLIQRTWRWREVLYELLKKSEYCEHGKSQRKVHDFCKSTIGFNDI